MGAPLRDSVYKETFYYIEEGELGPHLTTFMGYFWFYAQKLLLAGLETLPGIEPWLAMYKANSLPAVL